MAYDLQMQLNLQAPSAGNVAVVKKSIESGLSNIRIGSFDSKSFAKATNEIEEVKTKMQQGQKTAKSFWEVVQGKTASFAAYTVASTAILKLTGAVANATREAIKYETEIIKISQVTGDSVATTKEYGKSLLNISKTYNVNITKVAQLTRTLSQTGLSFREAAKGAELLARTNLLASFESLTSTTEGLIAVMQTFNLTVKSSGVVLEEINAVSKAFAVESGDIVEAIRRTGGAFNAAGGSVEELIALFTSVRSTSRESAETIATGFRTIFGRLQRPKTIEYFKQLGIQLETAEGQFVGPYKAIQLISQGLEEVGIQAGSIRFAEVVEQIGGVRQLSKVVPLLEQFGKAQQALGIQSEAGAESVKDLEKAQQGLGFQLGTLQKEFSVLIQEFVGSDSFKFLAETFINIARAVIRLTSSFQPLLPILATFAAFKLGRGLTKLLSGGFNLQGLGNLTGGVARMASGGIVPGTGNGDTVPAMLTPGEFVIRKSAVKAFGASNLASINRYAAGGLIKGDTSGIDKQVITYDDVLNSRDLSPSAKGSSKGIMFERLLRNKIQRTEGVDTEPDFANLNSREKEILNIPQRFNNAEVKVSRKRAKRDAGKYSEDTAIVYGFAKGGAVGTDTVPALLTPGEFVVNKKSAQAYGYNNLKNINKYAKGGIVQGFQNGGKVDDLQRGTGPVIKSMTDFTTEMNKVISTLGATGEEIEKTYKLVEEMSPSARGSFSPAAKEIRTAIGRGTTSTVAHEAGHAVDYTMGAGAGYASEQEGTLQNELAKAAQKQIAEQLKIMMESGKISKQTYEYRTNIKEIFADLFEKSDPAVRQILASTTDAQTGMEEIAKLFAERPDKFKRLYADIDTNLESLSKNIALQVALTAQSGQPEKPTAKGIKAEAMLGGQAAVTEKIAERSGVLKGLQAAQSKAEAAWLSSASKLEKLDNQIAQGITNQKAQQRAAAIRIRLQKEAIAAEKAYNNITEQVTAVTKQREALIGQARGMKQQRFAALQQGTPGSFPKTSKLNKQVEKTTTLFGALLNNVSKLNVSFPELLLQSQAFASALKNFAGIDINQAALTNAQVSASQLSAASDALTPIANERAVKGFGSTLNKVGKSLPKSIGGPVRKVGGILLKNGANIAKFAGKAAKGLSILARLELAFGFLDAIFSTDYSKQRDNLIQLGDAAGAATAAAKAYSQEQYRAIPIIGSLLSAFGAGSGATEENIDDLGKLSVANARLEATLVGTDKAVARAKEAFTEASRLGDVQAGRDAVSSQLEIVDNLRELGSVSAARAQALQDSGADRFGKGGSIFAGVTGGLASGATLGAAVSGPAALIGAAIGGISGALIGGVTAWYKSSKKSKEQITQGFELNAEAIKKGSEVQVGLIDDFSKSLQAATVQAIRGGGGYAEALEKVSERFGPENIEKLLGRRLGADPSEDIDALKGVIEESRERVRELKIEQAETKQSNTIKRAKIQVDIEAAQAELDAADAARKASIETRAVILRETELKNAREIQAAAIERQLKLTKQLTKALDILGGAEREIAAIEDSISKIGTGQLTQRETAQQLGIDSNLLEMSVDQIARDPQAFNKMIDQLAKLGAGTGEGGVFAEEARQAQTRVAAIEQIRNLDLREILKDTEATGTTEEDRKSRAENVREALAAGVGIDLESDPILKSAIQEYATKIVGSIEQAGEAEEAARELALKTFKELASANQEKLIELVQKEQQYRQLQIELIDRQAADAKKSYDLSKQFADERNQLLAESAAFFDIDTTPQGQRRATTRRVGLAEEAASEQRRRAAAIISPDRLDFSQLDRLINGLQTSGAEFRSEAENYADVIRDTINVEKDKLNALREQATAQRELTQALRDAQGDLISEFAFGTEQQRGDLLRVANAAEMAASQGSLAGISGEMRGDVSAFFDRFSDIALAQFGGRTGAQVKGDIAAEEAVRAGIISRSQKADFAAKVARQAVPVDQRLAEQIKNQEKVLVSALNQEEQLRKALLDDEKKNTNLFGTEVAKFGSAVDELRKNLGQNLTDAIANGVNAKIDADKAVQTLPKEQAPAQAAAQNMQQEIERKKQEVEAAKKKAGDLVVQETKAARELQAIKIPSRGGRQNAQIRRNNAQVELNNLTEQRKQASDQIQASQRELEALQKRYDAAMAPTSASSNPAQNPVIATPPTNQEPITIETRGEQNIVVSLPDIQAIVNKDITALVLNTVGEIFNRAASDVSSATDMNGVATALQNAAETSASKELGVA